MNPPQPDTRTLQQWLAAVITGPGHLNEKIARADHHFQVQMPDLVVGSAKVPADTRLEIYARGYMLRLLECMQADLPSLHAWLGESLFVMFAKGYLLQCPSQSFSLFELSSGFADFLDRTRPRHPAMTALQHAQYDLPAELVRVERARLAAMRSPGTEGQVMEAVSPDFFGALLGGGQRFLAHPALQLCALKMPLGDFYLSLMRGERPEVPQPAPAFLAVSRTRFRLRIFDLKAWQFYLLQFLQTATEPVSAAALAGVAAEKTGSQPGQILAEMHLWLPVAAESGLLVATSG